MPWRFCGGSGSQRNSWKNAEMNSGAAVCGVTLVPNVLMLFVG
jgi:hypothetical protein